MNLYSVTNKFETVLLTYSWTLAANTADEVSGAVLNQDGELIMWHGAGGLVADKNGYLKPGEEYL